MHLEEADKEKGEEKARLKKKAVVLLQEIIKVPSEHAAEAMHVLKLHGKGVAGERVEPKTFDEALNQGKAASNDGQWKDAVCFCRPAMEFGKKLKGKEKERLTEAEKALDQARYQLGVSLLRDETMEQALVMLEKLSRERVTSEVAPKAAAKAVSAALQLYRKAKDTGTKDDLEAALDRFQKLADYAMKPLAADLETD